MVKRFYKTVCIKETENGFKVLCDNKPLKCGGKNDLIVPHKALADMLAAEWENQGEEIDLKEMPITDFTTGLNSLTPALREKLISDSISFINTDVLFYRAEYPSALIERQNQLWDKVLIWAGNLLDASFETTNTITPVHQPEKTISALTKQIKGMDDFDLLCFYKFSSLTTSVLLGLAIVRDFLSAKEAFCLSRLEEDFQNEFWGKDSEAEKKRNSALQDILTTEQIFFTKKQ